MILKSYHINDLGLNHYPLIMLFNEFLTGRKKSDPKLSDNFKGTLQPNYDYNLPKKYVRIFIIVCIKLCPFHVVTVIL